MKYTVKELDVAKCEFVKKLKAAGATGVYEYEGTFFGYYRRITAFIGEFYVSVTIVHSPFKAGIASFNDKTGGFSDLTLEEFKNLKFPTV